MAARCLERYKALHVLVNNGGIPAGSSPLRLADVLAGGPQPLLDGLEDHLSGRAVARMTWAM